MDDVAGKNNNRDGGMQELQNRWKKDLGKNNRLQ